MVEKLSNYILNNILYKNEKIEGDQRDIMLFGVTRIIEDIPKYFIIFLLSLIFHVLSEVGIVLAVTLLYKTFIGGAHARTNLVCLISSTAFFFLPVIVSKFVSVNNSILYIAISLIFLFSIYVILRHAPADTEEVPILNKNKRNLFKVLGIVSLIIIYTICIALIKDIYISKIIFTTILLIDIFATKPMYKLYSCKHSYESDEFKEYFNN